jgi:lycopene cyclase domain-containing protein
MLTYLLIDLSTLAFPLAFSRSHRFGFGRRWTLAWWAVALSAIPFIAWDMLFTHLGVWSFNPEFILGVHAANLPLEEILFFFAIPFACLFIYQCLRKNLRFKASPRTAGISWGLLGLLLLSMAVLHADKIYTVSVCVLGALASLALALSRPDYSGALMAAIAAQYVPFLLVNGLLTFLPVVSYRDTAIMGWHIGSIPIEDAIYSFVMLAGPVALFEFLSSRRPA